MGIELLSWLIKCQNKKQKPSAQYLSINVKFIDLIRSASFLFQISWRRGDHQTFLTSSCPQGLFPPWISSLGSILFLLPPGKDPASGLTIRGSSRLSAGSHSSPVLRDHNKRGIFLFHLLTLSFLSSLRDGAAERSALYLASLIVYSDYWLPFLASSHGVRFRV